MTNTSSTITNVIIAILVVNMLVINYLLFSSQTEPALNPTPTLSNDTPAPGADSLTQGQENVPPESESDQFTQTLDILVDIANNDGVVTGTGGTTWTSSLQNLTETDVATLYNQVIRDFVEEEGISGYKDDREFLSVAMVYHNYHFSPAYYNSASIEAKRLIATLYESVYGAPSTPISTMSEAELDSYLAPGVTAYVAPSTETE